MQKSRRSVTWIILCICIAMIVPILTTKAASALKISYNGKSINYTKAKVKFTINGKNINLHGTPGIIVNNTSMGYYVDVFKKGLNADCSYDKATKQLTITKFNNTVQLKMNSKIAYVNGKKKTLSVPMMKIKYKAKGVNRISVPVLFVAKNLGYTYTWNSGSKTGVMKYSWLEINKGDTWEKYTGTQVKTSFNGEAMDHEGMPGIVVNNTAFLNGVAIFETGLGGTCTYNAENDTITVTGNDVTIVYTLGSTTVLVNGVEQTMANPPMRVKNRADGEYYLMVPAQFTATALGYRYNWNNKKKTSEISDTDVSEPKPEENVNTNANPSTGAGISFSLPGEFASVAITDEDMYYNNKFQVTIPGDCVDYLGTNPPVMTNGNVTNYEIALSDDGNTQIIFTTSKLQGYRVHNDNGFVWIEVGEPKEIYKNIVVLDCGHGGSDPGAQSSGYSEKNITYSILYTYAKQYFNASTSNVKAYWSRYDDTYIALSTRAAYADKVGADLFVSLHMNSATNTSAMGTEVYYSTSNNKTQSNGLTSKILATELEKNLLPVMNTTNRGVKTANYTVIHKNTVPAVLIELGFISNASDRGKIIDSNYQEQSAKTIYDTLENIFATYPTGR